MFEEGDRPVPPTGRGKLAGVHPYPNVLPGRGKGEGRRGSWRIGRLSDTLTGKFASVVPGRDS